MNIKSTLERYGKYWSRHAGFFLLFLSFLMIFFLTLYIRPVSWPAKGVVCDRIKGFCSDSTGVNQVLSVQFLGRYSNPGTGSTDVSGERAEMWSMSTGLTCSSTDKKCWIGPERRYLDPVATERIFNVAVSS